MADDVGATVVTDTETSTADDDAVVVVEEPPPPPPPRPDPPADMFISLAAQLDNIRRWNEERGWGFGPADFEAVELTPSSHDDPLVVDLVAVYLPADAELDGVRRTCHELWTVAAAQHPNAWSWDEKPWDERLRQTKQVRLLYGIVHEPGIRRVTVDLGAHWEPHRPNRSIDYRSKDSAHAEILAAAAHFPRWIRAMDGRSVPYALLSGYQVTMVEAESWRRLPCLSWNEFRATLSLTAHWSDHYGTRWASPVCVRST
ncbi:MAG: hypothetical protein M3N98_08350 [Actinomycetota bacterium]|nr:hypothetical protein [Actinomycetota bacterium]